MTAPAVGIDLGTTHSCVAVYQYGKVEIISNDHGSRTTPSWIAYTKEELLVGEAAKDQANLDPENTIYDMKRLIGRRYKDETVQSDIKNWPFKVVNDNGLPEVEITTPGIKALKPEEVSAIVLKKLKETAEAYLETKVNKAVITVPAYFTDYQREATMEAAKQAGLEVLRLINEPSAAAIAYGDTKEDMRGTLLVYDFGGGTLDVSIVTITDSAYIIKATSGNTHLGGQDFTNNLLEHIINIFDKKHNKQIRNNKRAVCRLREECENAKKELSFSTRVRVFVDYLVDGIPCDEQITRAKFDELNADLFQSALDPVTDALKSSYMTKDDIDKVVIVGGSSRIPKIKSLLEQFFIDRKVFSSINPDEAIAYGACIHAAVYCGIDIKNSGNCIIRDIIPMALGIAVKENFETFDIVIEKNATIPISRTRQYYTLYDNQRSAMISVYEGDDPKTKNNKFLGKFTITEVPPKPAGEEKFDVTFSIDMNGILRVYAKNISTGNDACIVTDRRF